MKNDRRTALEYTAEALRDAILRGEITGGSHITQTDVANKLGVSTTPVREALRQLAAESLVVLDKHRGATVLTPNLSDALEIFDLRRLLEPYAATLATQRISETEISKLRDYHSAMLGTESLSEWFTYNRNFHQTVIGASKSPRLIPILNGLINATAIYLALSLRTVTKPFIAGNEDHGAMVGALEARDADRLSALVLRHLDSSLKVIRNALDEEGGAVTEMQDGGLH